MAYWLHRHRRHHGSDGDGHRGFTARRRGILVSPRKPGNCCPACRPLPARADRQGTIRKRWTGPTCCSSPFVLKSPRT